MDIGSECQICKEEAIIPHYLPCEHIFCFICIIKHLRNTDSCPKCLQVFSRIDLKTNCKKYEIRKMPSLIFKRTETNLKKILKQYLVITEGSKRILEWRFMVLIDLFSLEEFKIDLWITVI